MANEVDGKDLTALLTQAVDIGGALTQVHDVAGVKYAVVPEGFELKSLEAMQFGDYQPRPHRIKAARVVYDPQSFGVYFADFDNGTSLIVADRDKSQIKATFDYHESKLPAWGSHTCTLALRHTEEWKAWIGSNKKPLSQEDLAEFIEDHTPDIVSPSAATMIEVAETIRVSSGARFDSAVKRTNGQVQITYHEDIQGSAGAGGKLSIPESFKIRLAVYDGMEAQEFTCRFRYRLSGAKLSMWYDILRVDAAIREAFTAVCGVVTGSCGQDVLRGQI